LITLQQARYKIVGIYFGLKTFLILSDNKKVKSSQYYLKHLNQLKKLPKRLSKKIKGYKLAKKQLARLH
jgi:putative transposase